jgi:hypothetical protein
MEDEYEFPDEKKAEAAPEFEFEIEDDTPEKDRNRDAMPKEVVDDLDKDELEEYSDSVKTKLKQFKKVWHDERREKEQALREQNEAMAYAQSVQNENRALKSRLSDGEKSFIETYKGAAELEINAAKKEYKEAYDLGDSDQLVNAQEKLSGAQYKLQKAKEYVPALQEPEIAVNRQAEVPKPDSRAMAWQERNTWFGKDEEMTSLALGLHQKLVTQHGASYASTDEYWKKVDETMHRRFPENFEEKTQPTSKQRTQPNTIVASASRSTSSKKVMLKQSQLNIAKKLKLTPEQYYREVQKMEANNG